MKKSSNKMSEKEPLTLKSLGLTYPEFAEMSNLRQELSVETQCQVTGLPKPDLQELYRQCGITKPFFEPRSMEGLQYLLLWLYISGRASYLLNSYGKIEWTKFDINRTPYVAVPQLEVRGVSQRIGNVLNIPQEHAWLCNYLAEKIVDGSSLDIRFVLKDIMLNGGNSLIREDYRKLIPNIDLKEIKHRRKRICFTRLQLFALFDRIRIDACHLFKGSRAEYANIMRYHNRPKMVPEGMIVPNLKSSPLVHLLIRSFRLLKIEDGT
ncbi:hypothetical protein EOM57_02735 [Candidatus Saccharibacteria bacterium]|nr:hypothetical protein [Candidatus Saccharibacteria bacterium]